MDTPGPLDSIVVSPIGEPGCGKSTFSMWLCHRIKMAGVSCEFAPEVIKYRSYRQQDKDRIVSGTQDIRMLRLQHAVAMPLIGHCEVVVNDGSLALFHYYSMLRLKGKQLDQARSMVDRYMRQQGADTHRFVTVERQHAYETTGRRQSEDEAIALRHDILATMQREFGIVPEVLRCHDDKVRYADDLVAEAITRRRTPARALGCR